jgi:nuclear pore complex protein Nup107
MDSDDQVSGASASLDHNMTVTDMLKIRAIEWLTFDRSMRSEALRQTNAIARVFLIQRKLAACREATHQLPSDSIDAIMTTWRAKIGEAPLPAADANAIRELLCIKAYLDAEDSFADWFKHYHNAKPVAPTTGLGGNFTERVAFEHMEQQHNADMERWKHSLDHQTRVTVEKIYNVLLFIDGGWMVDQQQDASSMDQLRAHQLMMLRQICLPSLCFILHKVLHTTRQYKQCMQLADHIASEQHQLYKVFRSEELVTFLQKLHSSSVALLDEGKDPLGYPLNE